eukprot:jgi/Tetstr1/464880/TSEL_009617.t1
MAGESTRTALRLHSPASTVAPRWRHVVRGARRASRPSTRRPAQTTVVSASPPVVKPPSSAGGSRDGEGKWFYSETGQKTWVDAMELDTLTPDMPALLQELGVSYDPDRLASALAPRSGELNARAVKVATTLGLFLSRVARDYATGRLEQNMERRAGQLRKVLSDLGPSFVKIGQGLSSRPDLLPKAYLEKLSALQDQLPSFPTDIAMRLIEEELGMPIESLFAEITDKPVAAASLGQVYKGKLHSGETVAIKVQRPGIADSIAVDMLLLRRLMKIVDRNTSEVTQDLVPLVDEFAQRLFGELDYMAEGRSCEKFTSLYSNVPRIRTPKIYWDFSSRRVLTMEWIDGVKLTDEAGMAAAGLEVVDFVDVGIECTLRQLLEHGYFHADPHPGNLLATKGGDLVYLDFGMMSEAPPNARYAIIAHVVHLVNRDYYAMCEDYYELDFMDRSVDTRPIAPALAEFFDDVLESSVSKLNFRAIVDGLGDVLFKFPFTVPPYYALILRSLTVLEGLAITADPEYKLLAKAYPYMAKRLLTDPSPQLRKSFEGLVLRDGAFRWNRFENLLREGSQSSDFDPEQLWVLAKWLISPSADAIRRPLADEFVRLVDGFAAGSVREQIHATIGEDMADRLVPIGPRELDQLERGRMLLSRATGGADLPELRLAGSGPFGVMTPREIQNTVQSVRQDLARRGPQVQQLLQEPGMMEVLNQVTRGLVSRAAARAVKLVAGLSTPRPPPSSTSGRTGR